MLLSCKIQRGAILFVSLLVEREDGDKDHLDPLSPERRYANPGHFHGHHSGRQTVQGSSGL